MTTREEVVAEARDWIGTKFVHQGRLKGIGCDCLGLVIGVAHVLGLAEVGNLAYGRSPDPTAMRAGLREHLDEVAFADVQSGDILWFRVAGEPRHVGIVTTTDPLSIVHSYSRERVMACIEQNVDAFWRSRIVAAFRFRGLE